MSADMLQLAVVTLIALGGAAFLVRRFVRTPKPAPAGKRDKPGCDNCSH